MMYPGKQAGLKVLGYFFFGIGAAILIGVFGYYLGFLRFVYDIMMPNAFGRFDLFTLAVITGVAAFFSPCAFPLLPSYIAYSLASQEEHEPKRRLSRSLYFGVVGALGVMFINLMVGIAIAGFGAAFFQPDPRLDHPLILAARITVGVAIAALGAVTLAHHSFSIGSYISSRLSRLTLNKEKGSSAGMFFYGMLYNGAAVGCTGPILLSLMLFALTIGSFITAVIGFVIFSLTMAALMFTVTTLVGLSKTAAISKLKKTSLSINKLSGAVMMAVGILTVALTGNEFFTRIFFPFLPARPIATSDILWVGITLGALPTILGYVALTRKRK